MVAWGNLRSYGKMDLIIYNETVNSFWLFVKGRQALLRRIVKKKFTQDRRNIPLYYVNPHRYAILQNLTQMRGKKGLPIHSSALPPVLCFPNCLCSFLSRSCTSPVCLSDLFSRQDSPPTLPWLPCARGCHGIPGERSRTVVQRAK